MACTTTQPSARSPRPGDRWRWAEPDGTTREILIDKLGGPDGEFRTAYGANKGERVRCWTLRSVGELVSEDSSYVPTPRRPKGWRAPAEPSRRAPSILDHRAKTQRFAEQVGARIRAHREAAGLSIDALAKTCGVGKSTIGTAEEGSGVSLYLVARIAEALDDVTLDDLVPLTNG